MDYLNAVLVKLQGHPEYLMYFLCFWAFLVVCFVVWELWDGDHV